MVILPGAYSEEVLKTFQGKLIDGELDVSDNEKALSQDFEEVFYISLENPLYNEDGTNNTTEVVWGTSSRQRRLLRPGDQTNWLPLRSLKEIWVRTIVKGAGRSAKISWIAII